METRSDSRWGFIYLILIILLVSSSAFSQGNQENLRRISSDYREQRMGADQRIKNYVRKYPGTSVSFVRNNTVYLMVDVSESGVPEYFKTNNSAEATTLNVPKLRTGGNLGINMTGSGIKLGTWDGGRVRTDHQELTGRVTIGDGAITLNDHATHTSGTMLASGVSALAKGMAPNATLIAYDFNNDVSEMAAQAKPDQTSLLLSNHSYGTLAGWEWNGTSWTWYGDPSVSTTIDYKFGFYNTQSQQWDNMAYNAPYYLIVKAAGNDRNDAGDGSKPADGVGGYDCIPTYGVAKNILTVGAVENLTSYNIPSDVKMTTFSSWGPTDDGRIKPDLVAPGLNVFSSVSSSTNAYATASGTSMSTPAVTGTLGVLQQLYKSFNSGNYMRSATVKALAIHTCREAGSNPGPDYSYGWGLLDAEAAASTIMRKDNKNVFILENTLTNSQTYELNLGAAKAGTLIKATMVWTDPAGVPNAAAVNNPAKKLINDLDIRLIDDANTISSPWILNPSIPSAAATTGDNTLDNVERVELSSAAARSYKIRVTNKGTLQSGTQAFSLIVEFSSIVDPPKSYYWIGNSGSWEDGTHWSLTSGGVASNVVPGAGDKVVFDENSFTVSGSTISMNSNNSTTSLRWLANQYSTNLSMNGNTLTISEGTLITTDKLKTPTAGIFSFISSSTGTNSVDMGTSILDKLVLNFNSNSSWSMTGGLTLDKIILTQGTLSFNGCAVVLNQLASAGAGTFNFTNTSFSALQGLSVDFTGATIQSDATSSMIILPVVTNTINLASLNYQGLISMQAGEVSVTGTNQLRSISGNGIVRLNGNLLVSNLTLSGGSQLILQSGATQTLTDKLVFATSSTSRVTITSSSTGKATLAFSKYVKACLDNVDVMNVDGDISNGSVFNAGVGGTVSNSLNWQTVDCSTILFPDFTISYACINASVYFTDASSGTVTSRSWNFGDGSSAQNTSSLTSPVNYYTGAGPFTVTLTVNGPSGSRTVSKILTLTANDLPDNTVQFSDGTLFSTNLTNSYQWLKDDQIITGATGRTYNYGGTPALYSVLTFSTACNKRSTPFLVTAIEDEVNSAQTLLIKIYPNPTSDFLQVESNKAVLGIFVMDALGRELRLNSELMNENRYRLNVTDIPNGIYILKVVTPQATDLQKVVIRK